MISWMMLLLQLHRGLSVDKCGPVEARRGYQTDKMTGQDEHLNGSARGSRKSA